MARADKLLVEEQTTLFAFDAFGNLARTTDPKNNVVAVSYDNWGRRKQLKDPDLGTINYGVDALGQVRSQVSPNEAAAGQQTVMEYDALGRMTSRLAADMHAVWTYDQLPSQSGCQASRSCGKLVESKTLAGGAAVDFLQQHSYDLLGRPELTTTVLDQPYTSRRVYDSWGRLVSEQHQYGSGAAKAYDRRYNAWGQLWKIEGKGQVLWQASAKDAAQRLTGWSLGNGLAATRVFNPYTGRLMSGSVGTKLGEAYQYDVLGNVSQRLQIWEASSFTENFDYDGLNRLKMATIVGFPAQEFTYDDIGNLLTKSGVGSGPYVYPASGANSVCPHAVASIPGLPGGEFGYDLNGNMTSGAGRTVSWTSFDMPNTISKGAASSTFYYGADRQRVKQQRNDGSTVWYAGALEVETGSGGATVKTYLPDGIGVEIEKAGGSTLYYLHRDRLGSVVAMSSQAGELVESQAYDSWGKRREQASPATPDQLDGVLDNKGFTGHEMLDQLDLVHMNGRVYDPLVARFMSADPIIQEPEHSQSYNRYTYVWNNPTNLTDPTGFIGEGPRPANSVIPECQDSRTECGSGGKPSRDEQPQSNENKSNKGKERNAVPGQSANTSVSGLDPKGLPSALLDTAKAGWNTGVNLVEGGINLLTGAIPGAPDYVPFANGVRANYDTPVFGEVLEFLMPLKALNRGNGKNGDASIAWPPNRGFDGDPLSASLIPGTRVDRYGSPGGTFVAPEGTPFSMRSLPEASRGKPLNTYEVLRPIEVQAGPAAPWFGQRGGGMQYEFPNTVQYLLNQGYLRQVKPK